MASQNGHKDVVKLLVEKGAYVNCLEVNGMTPLHWASHKGHREVVKLLIDHKAAVNDQNNK